MKRMIPALLALSLCLTLLASCGGKTSPSEPEASQTTAPEVSQTTTEDPMEELDAKIEAFINDPEIVEAINEEDPSEDGMVYRLQRENHKLIFECRLTEEDSVTAKRIADAMAKDSNVEYLDLLDLLRDYTGNDDAKLVLRLVDAAGETVYEQEFDKNTERVESPADDRISLAEFIDQELSEDVLNETDSEDAKLFAEAEGENTLVLRIVMQSAVPEESLEAVRAQEQASMEEDETLEDWRNIFEMMQSFVAADELFIRLVVEDISGAVLAEKTFNEADFA